MVCSRIPYAIEQGIFRVLSVKICVASGKQIASSSSASATLSACEFIRERRHWVYASQLGFLFGYLARFAGRQHLPIAQLEMQHAYR
jgi:hypothetical protein